MSESLLSFSEVLLFGRLVEDLAVRKGYKTVRLALVDDNSDTLPALTDKIDDVPIADGDKVLVQVSKDSEPNNVSGLYKVKEDAANPGTFSLESLRRIRNGKFVFVQEGKQHAKTFWKQKARKKQDLQYFIDRGKRRKGWGANNFVGEQFEKDPSLARIYGFAYDGTYYELPEPTIFLVHGEGESATDHNIPENQAGRAPLSPSESGVASADYQMSNDIRVWDYDKADYTIRMDVLTGQFEQVLLDLFFGSDGPSMSGARVSGARVSGARVSGARVSGARVSGARVSGARARGSED